MVFTSYIFGFSSNVRGSIGKFHGMVLELTSIRLPEVKSETFLLIAHSASWTEMWGTSAWKLPDKPFRSLLKSVLYNYYHWHLKNCHSILNSGQIRWLYIVTSSKLASAFSYGEVVCGIAFNWTLTGIARNSMRDTIDRYSQSAPSVAGFIAAATDCEIRLRIYANDCPCGNDSRIPFWSLDYPPEV